MNAAGPVELMIANANRLMIANANRCRQSAQLKREIADRAITEAQSFDGEALMWERAAAALIAADAEPKP